jgi:hypothetical protein
MESLSRAEKDTITREIKAEISRLIAGCESLDMDLAFDMFLDAPDFLMMGTDGTLCDFNTYLKNNIDYLNTCAGFELTTFKEEIRILGLETAIFSWAYGVEATLKKGKMDIIENAGASFIFRKMDGKWKVVYYHESSVPPKRISRMQ